MPRIVPPSTQLVGEDTSHVLQATFAQLPAQLQEWLLLRRYHESDLACSKAMTGQGDWHRNYKSRNLDFRKCYGLLLALDTSEADKVLVESLVQSNALKSLIEERKILEVPWQTVDGAEIGGRLATVKGAAMKAAIDRVKGTHSVTEHVYRVEEVMKVIDVGGGIIEENEDVDTKSAI